MKNSVLSSKCERCWAIRVKISKSEEKIMVKYEINRELKEKNVFAEKSVSWG